MVAIELFKRASWWQSAMGGVAAVFAAVSVASGYVLSNYCSDTFLLVAGLVEGPIGRAELQHVQV